MAGTGKYEILRGIIKGFKKVVVAFSGGVDSTLLLKVCSDALGPENVLAFLGSSSIHPERETREAVNLARQIGLQWLLVETKEMADPGFRANRRDRCYICKASLLDQMWEVAKREGLSYAVEGSNLDDDDDFRPGSRAVAEKGVLSPLRMAGLTKDDVRELSRMLNLPTHDKPSFACLASRIPYGTTITEEILKRIEFSEDSLRDLGFAQVRVRYHGDVARLEVTPSDMEKVLFDRERICKTLVGHGFTYVALDLKGYRTGSLNESPLPSTRLNG